MNPKGVSVLESLTWERGGGEEDDPGGSDSQNVRGELGWGVIGLFILYFWGGGGGKHFRIRARDLFSAEQCV